MAAFLLLRNIGSTSPSVDAVRGTLARLTILWPSLLKLSEAERYVVVTAAATCEIYRLPADAKGSDVASCLREGARKHDGQRTTMPPITRQLDQLLVSIGR